MLHGFPPWLSKSEKGLGFYHVWKTCPYTVVWVKLFWFFFLLHLATRARTDVLGASPLGCLPVTSRCFNLDCLNHQSTTIPAQGHTGAKPFHWSSIQFPSFYKWAWAVLIISTLSWMAQKGKKGWGEEVLSLHCWAASQFLLISCDNDGRE